MSEPRAPDPLLLPVTRADLLFLVESWKALDQVSVHKQPWKGAAWCFYTYNLPDARDIYRRYRTWENPAFARNPDLRAAAMLATRAFGNAAAVQELLELAEPGFDPPELTAAWAALWAAVREARPLLPDLASMP